MRTVDCRLLVACLIAGTLTVGAAYGQAAATQPKWGLDVAVLNTAAQAWALCGQNQDEFSMMVQKMVGMVSANRGLQLPNDRVMGQKIGGMVAREVLADPDNLLYAIVDHAILATLGPQAQCMIPTSVCEPAPGKWTPAEMATSTVTQAWQISGQNKTEFRKMLETAVALSLENRGLALEDSKDNGIYLGNVLRTDLEAHPNDLLYTVADRSVRMVATVPAAK
ncbi:MAG: hypothetical protein ABFE08_04805 [Armatimonadia bacterium]